MARDRTSELADFIGFTILPVSWVLVELEKGRAQDGKGVNCWRTQRSQSWRCQRLRTRDSGSGHSGV